VLIATCLAMLNNGFIAALSACYGSKCCQIPPQHPTTSSDVDLTTVGAWFTVMVTLIDVDMEHYCNCEIFCAPVCLSCMGYLTLQPKAGRLKKYARFAFLEGGRGGEQHILNLIVPVSESNNVNPDKCVCLHNLSPSFL
jgi:hypothetical protein